MSSSLPTFDLPGLRSHERGPFLIELRFAQLSNRTNNAIAAGSFAGAVTAVTSPGTLGVVCGSFAFAIPVIGQTLAAGTVAALAINAIPDYYPQAPVLTPLQDRLADLELEKIYLNGMGRSTAHIDRLMLDLVQPVPASRAHSAILADYQ